LRVFIEVFPFGIKIQECRWRFAVSGNPQFSFIDATAAAKVPGTAVWQKLHRSHLLLHLAGQHDFDSPAAMNRSPQWFQRKFEFSFPVELHPNLCARLRGTPARLEEAVRGTAHDLLARKTGEKWSAQEHAGHLLDLEPLWMARVNDYLTEASTLTTADLTNRKTHEAQHNQRPINEILANFRNARSRLVSQAEKIDPAVFARALPHPRLQTPMRLVDHLYFVAEHDDHHLAHIWELINGSAS
jgi:hypothetical protein